MNCNFPSLTIEQSYFLQNNFVVYDPDLRKYHTDFSCIHRCQVILLGEIHESSVIKKCQKKFFKLFISDAEKSCLLIEGLSRGQRLAQLPGFKNLSEKLTLLGSDSRAKNTAEEYLPWLSLREQLIDLKLKSRKNTKEIVCKAANFLNSEFHAGKAKVFNNVLRLSTGALQEFENLYQIPDDGEEELLIDQMNDLVDDDDPSYPEVVKSNEDLLHEIKEACKQYDKVIGRWGLTHFISDDKFYLELEKAGLDYIVLLPNEKSKIKDSKKSEWRKPIKMTLEVIVKETLQDNKILMEAEHTKMKLPKVFKHFFHPSIQAIMVEKNTYVNETIIINSERLAELCSRESLLTFPANVWIQFEGFPLNDSLPLREINIKATQQKKEDLDGKDRDMFQSHLVSGINQLLLWSNLQIKLLKITGTFSVDSTYQIVRVLSTQPFTIEVHESDYLTTSAIFLLKEMKLKQLSKFIVNPKQHLAFTDISFEDGVNMINNPALLLEWLSSRAPKNTEVSLQGLITINREINSRAVALVSPTGFQIKIKPL